MATYGQAVQPTARAELQAWYLASLHPKLERAASTGIVPEAATDALDQQLRDFLDLPAGAGREAA